MPFANPRYLLFAAGAGRSCQPHCWRFLLEPAGEGQRLAASDVEHGIDRNRLELLAVVRGLEALEQPSEVTLLTGSRYVRRGLRYDLGHWREANWRWESFGRQVPIRDHDLWKRVDQALGIHRLHSVRWQLDESEHESGEWMPAASVAAADCRAADRQSIDRAAAVAARLRPRHREFRRPRRPRVTSWGQGVLAAMTALGRPALSRTA
jgi:ribonuclease HI